MHFYRFTHATVWGFSASVFVVLGVSVAQAQVAPPSVNAALAPGQSVHVDKIVQTPSIPPNPDIVFYADTTGSMGTAIANVKANATSIMNTVQGAQPTAQFAVAEYRDRAHCGPDPFNFRVTQALTSSIATAQAKINAWTVGNGCDTPECQLSGLRGIPSGALTFRPGSTRIIVWFGDSNGHDPCGGSSLGGAITALQSANVIVIAVPVTTGGNGLNNGGQATAIANATGGSVQPANPNNVANAILAGLMNLPTTVTPTAVGCAPLTVMFNPASRTVTSGDPASFEEWITAPNSNDFCDDVHCTVEFRDAGGNTIGEQEIWVTAVDVEDPVAICPVPVIVECDGGGEAAARAAWLAAFGATDNCPGVTFDRDITPLPGCGTIVSMAVTNTATDAQGNTDACSSTFIVVDSTQPDISCPADVALQPTELDCKVTFDTLATATDACDPDPAIVSVPPLPAMFDKIGDHIITFTATDDCGNASSCEMTVTVLPTPYCLKREAIVDLEVLLAVDSEDDDLIDAIGFLHMSLGEDDDRAGMSGSEVIWGDPNHVDTCHLGFKGADAFQYEQEACDKLDAYVENDENGGFGFEAAIDAVRESLAAADEMLAATAIADAIANAGKSDEIEVAMELKAEGDAATASGGSEICDVALDKYEEAWEKAVKSWCESE